MDRFDRTEIAVGLVRIVALHDEATAVHLQATAALARRIALHLQLGPDAVENSELAGLLHDIGKVRVGRTILNKVSELSADEWVLMRKHAADGATVVEGLAPLAHLAPIVRAHHERMDGHGYPDRLAGSEIPMEARVVAVADAFHALTTDRPYRRAVLPQTALAVLRSAAHGQFDPDVVAAALDLFGQSRSSRRLSA